MPQKTNLNVTPYFDDFDATKNFQEVLFRPGFAVQARELTTLQSILKNQMEKEGRHLFKEGAMIVPGQLSSFKANVIKLQNQFASEDVDTSQYVGAKITGVTSGVEAVVITHSAATDTDPPSLFIQYTKGSSSNKSVAFSNGEDIKADKGITHTTAYSADVSSATTATTNAADRGVLANVQSGIYFVRGSFVECAEETLIVSKYDEFPDKRIGFTISETLVTPESDTSLLDNSTGSSNFAAKGAHRLKLSLTLSAIDSSSTDDDNFVEVMRIKKGRIIEETRGIEFGTIEDTFARRTFDESGDYSVRPFQYEIRECLDNNEFKGLFQGNTKTDDGNTTSNSLLALKASPGKSYIKGFEVEKIAPTIKDLDKARDTAEINAGITINDVGNFLNISNVYNTPDIEFVQGESSAYKQVELFDTPTTTRGSSSGTMIGVSRARTMQYSSGTAGLPEAVYKLYLFDIRPFTFLTLSGTPSPIIKTHYSRGGILVTGATSGAKGFVFADGTGGTKVVLTNVIGSFSTGEKIKVSDSTEADGIVEDSGNTDLTITSIKVNTIEDVRQVFMDDDDSGQDFSADVVLDNQNTDASFLVIDGTDTSGANSDDLLRMEDGTTTSTSLGDNISIERAAAAGTGSSKKIAKLQESEKNISLFKLNKRTIKTHLTDGNNGQSDTQITIRRQYVATSSGAGVVTISAGSGETFLSHSEADYTMSILAAGAGGSANQGDIVSCATGFSGGGTATVSITNNAALGNAAKVKIIATLLKTSVTAKAKTAQLMKQVKVVPGSTGQYGTRPTDVDISLGRADSFKLVAVYDSEETSTDAVAPTMTLGTQSGIFVRGEKITGGTSGATGRLITISTPVSFVLNSGLFVVGDVITGESSGATATITALTDGSEVITSRFELDTGQRDNLYDISRIVRKPSAQPPLGRLLIVHDYLEHGAGDVFTVDSYTDVANQMDYEDIPQYNATKVDPDQPAPTGTYPLQDVFDMRPRVEDIAGTNTSVSVVDEVNGNSFDFEHRQFDGTGASTVHTLKPGSSIQSDFEYFLPYRAYLHIDRSGRFVITKGAAAEQPEFPKEPDGMMKLAEIIVPAFTFKPSDVRILKEKNQRYTMKDIGRLERRIDTVEYYTALSLLERDAESFEIQDSNGLNRFKSGFIVDNFGGHRVGDVQHPDYKNSMDMAFKELRPKFFMKGLFLEESVSTDTDRSTAGYKKTGDLITLPYTEDILINQTFSSRLERITPVLLSNWIGKIQLTPSSDEWFETQVAPDLIINVEGNFDTFLAANQNAIGTVWNAWQTQWSGTTVRHERVHQGGGVLNRTIETVRTDLIRTGLQTEVVERIDFESQGTKIISRAVIPFIRSRNVRFEGVGFYPNTRVFAFFDKRPISKHCTPDAGFSTNDASLIQGDALVTSANGEIKGTFQIPDPTVAGNEKWQSGEIQFRLTSSENNVTSIDPVTAGEVIFFAQGILNTEQETILAVRNAELVRTEVTQTDVITSTRVLNQNFQQEDGGDGFDGFDSSPSSAPDFDDFGVDENDPGFDSGMDCGDPLFQSFLVESEDNKDADGLFITSVDIYHGEKDSTIPVTLEIRDMINGHPGPHVLPFGRVTKNPDDISVSTDASVATTYTFPSPVFLKMGKEYGIALLTGVPTHKVWISRMGETETGGTRTISRQPELGVLFKGHNNRTWAPSLTEDLKFTLRKAKFTTGTTGGTVTLQNSTLPVQSLQNNPLIFTNGDATLKIIQPDHHMYSTSNNVTINGVKSGASTTLNGGITSAATTMTLADATNFDDTSGKFSNDASSEWYVKIDDEIMKYTAVSGNTISSITRGQDGTTAASHADGATVELYMLHKVPFTEINKTHTALGNIGIDSYTIELSTSPTISGGSTTAQNGGSSATATQNALYDIGQLMMGTLKFNSTNLQTFIRGTSGTSPSGTESSFVKQTDKQKLEAAIGENIYFDTTKMVCSGINETNEQSGNKSLNVEVKMTSNNENISPVLDTTRMTLVAVANRLNKIDSSSDVFPTTDFAASTEPNGDNNAAIYITKKITLENTATSIRVLFAAYRHSSADIEVMFKTLRTDDSTDFDDLGWEYFNTDGSPDNAVPSSLTRDDFKEYEYTAGVNDDGTGQQLPPFISFAIKIVMKGTQSCESPRIKDFRAIALAT